MSFSRLIYRGNYSLTCEVEFALLSADYGDGYGEDALVGSSHGLRAWSLNYPALTRYAFSSAPHSDFHTQSRADYIWEFWCASKAAGNAPFIVQCPRDGKDYLAVFVENKLTYQMVNQRLFTTGLQLKQRRVKGVVMEADGSLGYAED